MMKLKNVNLLQSQSYVNGQWVNAASGNILEVINPSNGSLIAHVSDCSKEDAVNAIVAAQNAFPIWSNFTASERAKVLKNWFDLMIYNIDDLALILTSEQGKPLSEAKGEIAYGASFVEWFAEEARRIYGDIIPGHTSDKRIMVIKQPVGVVAAITPWNFPNAMITRKIAPALAAGCTVVIKPSELTPLSALALAALGEQAGFPPGVLNILTTSDASEIGKVFCDHVFVKKISFTGSTRVGKILLEQSAHQVKKVTLELGGNAPFIVFNDADIEEAVDGCIASKFRNAGQTCVCANRIFVQDKVFDKFTSLLSGKIVNLVVGDGIKEGVEIGPLINENAVKKVEKLLADAAEKGGVVATGGKRLSGLFYEPTLISKATREMDIFNTEIFGPVAALYKFTDVDEVIELANDSPFGLAAYFYGRDYALIWKVAEALEYGIVGVNTGMVSTAVAPFGGVKESGIGREGSKYGIDDYLNIKYVCWGGI